MESLERKESSKSPPKTTSNESNVTSVAQRLKNLNLNTDYYCVQCAMKFDDEAGYTAHAKTEEHALMVLVTGIAYIEQDPQDSTQFPPLYYCVLCNIFCLDDTSYEDHLKGTIHKEMAQFMRCISFWKEKILVGLKCKNKEPSTAQDFEDLKDSPPHYCQLCDKQCNSAKTLENHTKGHMHTKLDQMVQNCEFCNVSFASFSYYERHLKSDLHTRIRDFTIKMLIPQTEITGTPKRRGYVSQCAGANQLPLLYYCKLCNIEFNDLESFRNHRNISTHRRIRNLINRISIKRDIDAMNDEEIDNQLVPRSHYCELCNVWCISSYQTYDYHVRMGSHLLNRSTEVVEKWDCSPESNPVGLKPWR